LHSDFERKEVIEIETPNDVEWSFQRKDFILTPQEQAPVHTEKHEEDNENFNDAENFPVEMAFENEKESSPEIHSPEIQRKTLDSNLIIAEKHEETSENFHSAANIPAEIVTKNEEKSSPEIHSLEIQRQTRDSNLIIAEKHEEDNEFFNDDESLPAEIVTKNEEESSPEIHSPEIQGQTQDSDLTTADKHTIEGQGRTLDSNLIAVPAEKVSPQEKSSVQLPEKRIGYLLLKARSLLLTNNFDEAHQIAKVVLQSDPSNSMALAIENYIQQSALETGDKFPSNASETRERMIKSVKDTWELPQVALENTHAKLDAEDWSHVFKHLNRIIIPKISFNNTPLSQAINTIIALSEQYDIEVKDQQKKGINVVVMRTQTEPEPTLSLNLKNMPLDKILNFIAKSTAYQFDIEDEVIVFRKAEGNLSENLVTEFFKISRSAIVRMTGIQSSSSESGNSGSDSGKNTGSALAEEERLIKEFLQKAGVNFAGVSGSNLAFDGSQLIITQSLRNIKRVKEILIRYEQVKQVEIETKFIEVQQGKLDELQFGWNLAYTHPGTKGEKAVHPRSLTIGSTNAGTDNSNIENLRTIHDAFTIRNEAGGKGAIAFTNTSGTESKIEIPGASPNSPGGLNLGVSATDLASLTGVISDKIGLNLTIRALEQQSGSDLMSAPKLTVLSGKTAKITVAQEFIYPKTYGEISSEVGTGDANSAGVTITAGTPSDFETRNVGVEMNVTPTVEENNCISLQLKPTVTEFEGFVEYGGRSIAISGNTRADLPPGFFQPIFSKREIQTEVTIYDGATVVMGGLTREEIKEVNDKIPLLGDIPLVGKLFRSKGETNQKKNLLIFVTANILSPGGTPVRMQNTSLQEPVYRSPKEGHWNVFTEIDD
jgi:general secretion pathway protein D